MISSGSRGNKYEGFLVAWGWEKSMVSSDICEFWGEKYGK